LAAWQRQLGQLAGVDSVGDATTWTSNSGYADWRLAGRRHLNPGSAGAPLFHLLLEPANTVAATPAWQAGDLLQVLPPESGAAAREYSIASLPASGRIELLVRQAQQPNGRLGLASGWLT